MSVAQVMIDAEIKGTSDSVEPLGAYIVGGTP